MSTFQLRHYIDRLRAEGFTVRDDHGDVVRAAGAQRQLDEPLRRDLRSALPEGHRDGLRGDRVG